jgi:RNA polymerase sigma-70 factor, ECF subfamily
MPTVVRSGPQRLRGTGDEPPAGERSDAALLELVATGDERAAAEFVARFQRRVFGLATTIVVDRAAAEDVAQEAFLKALDGLERFDGRRPFGAWLHRIAVNRAIDELRSGRRAVGLEEAPEPSTWPDEPWPAHTEIVAELGELPLERRLPIVLRHWLGLSVEETAELLGVPVGTVASRVSRGLADLRERLEVVHGH